MVKAPAQLSAELQQEIPWYICSECGEPVIIFNGRTFRTCECHPMVIAVTDEGIRRGARGV